MVFPMLLGAASYAAVCFILAVCTAILAAYSSASRVDESIHIKWAAWHLVSGCAAGVSALVLYFFFI